MRPVDAENKIVWKECFISDSVAGVLPSGDQVYIFAKTNDLGQMFWQTSLWDSKFETLAEAARAVERHVHKHNENKQSAKSQIENFLESLGNDE